MLEVSGITQDWATPVTSPDPEFDKTIVPGNRVIIRPCAVKTKTKGGIIITQTSMDTYEYLICVGKIVAVGIGVDAEDHPWAKVGAYVTYGRMAGNKFEFKGVKLLMMNPESISLVLDSVTDISSTFEIT